MARSSIRSPNRRSLQNALAAIAVSSLVLASPIHAQQAGRSAQSLKDLIPDSAVENPEDWALEGVDSAPRPAAEPEDTALTGDQTDPAMAPGEIDPLPEMNPDTPLAESVPGLTLDWPDGSQIPEFRPLDPEEGVRFAEGDVDLLPALPDGFEMEISDEVTLVFPDDLTIFPERDELAARFEELSTVVALNGDGDDRAQVAARAEEDETLLQRLLRVYGYYNAQVIRTVDANLAGADVEPEQAQVRFELLPDAQYRFGAIDLGDLAESGADYPALRASFEIETGDPLLQDRIVQESADLANELGEGGYPFFEMRNPSLLIDHAREEGDLTLPVTPGGKYRFGQVISSLPEFLPGEHLGDIARFVPGDIYKLSDEQDLRRAILATGLVGSVGIIPREVQAPTDGEPGIVDLDVEMTKAPLRTIAGEIGYGTGEGFRLEASWENRNFFPPEGLLRIRSIAGTREQLAGVTFRRNNVNGRDRVLTLDAYITKQDREAYEAKTIALTGTYELLSTILFQKELSWSGGFELIATREREADSTGALQPTVDYLIGALPVSALYDTSDSLLDPTEGFRVGGHVSPEVSHQSGKTSFYVSTQFDLSYYNQITDNVVLAARARAGTIQGAELADIAPSRRFYAGGGSSVRGYAYQAIGPRNSSGEPGGGRSLVEASLEARIRTGLMDGAIAIVPFIDAGAVDRSTTPTFSDIKFGAGVGIRYYTTFGPMRVDVATPINPGPDDGWIGVYVSLGQAF